MIFGLINLNIKFDKNIVVIYTLLFMTWYDMIFVTKEKIMFHDFITKTRVIMKNPDTYYESKCMKIINFIIPDFKEMFINMKDIAKSHINDIKNIFKTDADSVKEEEIKKEALAEFEEIENEKKSKKSSKSKSDSKATKAKKSKAKKSESKEEKSTDTESKKSSKKKTTTKKTTKKVVKKKIVK